MELSSEAAAARCSQCPIFCRRLQINLANHGVVGVSTCFSHLFCNKVRDLLEIYRKGGCRQQNKAHAKEAGSGLFCQTALIKIRHW